MHINRRISICLTTVVDKNIAQTQMFGVNYIPVWAMTLSSYIKKTKNFETAFYDTRIGKLNNLPEYDIYFVSGINQDSDAILSFQKFIRQKYPKAKIVLGGPITYSYSLVNRLDELSDFDSIFIGSAESSISTFLNEYLEAFTFPKIFHSSGNFNLEHSIKMDFDLIYQDRFKYYGGVIEVSRGCPFLCEFCDIRTLPNNNRANNKNIDLIIDEIKHYNKIGIDNILLACDNFIGNQKWAEELCDRIIDLKKTMNISPNFYTWLTINIAFNETLLKKMRFAGFEMFFIGVESFGENQLEETAKVQNSSINIKETIQKIQSFGFIVVAGIIFGFDTDPDDVSQKTLDGILESGLISGDPSLLTALPGTPLYKRMKLSNRLRKGKLGLGGFKYHTNIKYLMGKEKLIGNFLHFVKVFNQPKFQLARYRNFLKHRYNKNYISSEGKGYLNLESFQKILQSNKIALYLLLKRLFRLVINPYRLTTIVYGLFLTRKEGQGDFKSWGFWVFNWSNSIIKYSDLSSKDFDIDSIDKKITLLDLIPQGYDSNLDEPIPLNKIKAQRKITIKALSSFFAKNEGF